MKKWATEIIVVALFLFGCATAGKVDTRWDSSKTPTLKVDLYRSSWAVVRVNGKRVGTVSPESDCVELDFLTLGTDRIVIEVQGLYDVVLVNPGFRARRGWAVRAGAVTAMNDASTLREAPPCRSR